MHQIALGPTLVTGGGGFLGRAIIQKLMGRARSIRSFSRRFYPELAVPGVEQIQGDIADPEAVLNAAAGQETVFHTAARPGVWGDYEAYYRPNTTGTRNILSACIRRNVRCLIHTSSPSVVFNGSDMEGVDESVPYPSVYHSPYPETKSLAEQAVREASADGLPAVILRPHLIWGPGDNHLVPRILRRAHRLRIIGDGRNRVDTVYIDNAADAHILAAHALLRNPGLSGRIYFISNDSPVPLWDMVNAILAAGGKPPVTRRLSVRTARRIGISLEFIYKTLRLKGEPPLTRFMAEELSTAHWFDIRAAKTDLGYAPAISTEEGLRRLAEWLAGNRRAHPFPG